MSDISPELRAFLADWLAWVERGAPEDNPFDRDLGLCGNACFLAGIGNAHDQFRKVFGEDYPFGETLDAHENPPASHGSAHSWRR